MASMTASTSRIRGGYATRQKHRQAGRGPSPDAMAYVNFQKQRNSAKQRPRSSRQQPTADMRVQCVPAAISKRALKHADRTRYNDSPVNSSPRLSEPCMEQASLTIPLRVHISLSVPPSSPVAPCSTPELLDSASEETMAEDRSSVTPKSTTPDLRVGSSQESPLHHHAPFRPRKLSSSTRRPYSKSTPDLVVTAKRSQLQIRPSSGRSRPTSGRSSTTSRNSTPSPANHSRKSRNPVFDRNSMVYSRRGSPAEALHIKQCTQAELDNMRGFPKNGTKSRENTGSAREVIKVRKSNNAFVMTKDGSIKKCTVFIPVTDENEGAAAGKSVGDEEIAVSESKKGDFEYAEMECRVVDHPNWNETSSREAGSANRQNDKFRVVVTSKAQSPSQTSGQKLTKVQSRRNQSNSTNKESALTVDGSFLLPQYQQKAGDITFSDVLNTLNNIGSSERSSPATGPVAVSSKVSPATKSPILSTSNLTLWSEKRKQNSKSIDSKERSETVRKAKSHFVKSRTNTADNTRLTNKEDSVKSNKGNLQSSFSTFHCNKKAMSLLRQEPPSSRKQKKGKSSNIELHSVSQFNYRTLVLSSGSGSYK